MAKRSSVDLTQGSIIKQLIIYMLPILAGQVFQNLYNSVDAIIGGNYISTTALAAITSCSDIAHLLIGFFTGLSVGSGVLFARYFGAKKYDELHGAIHTGVLFSVVLGVVMAVVGIIFTPLLLDIVNCPADVWDESALYLRIYLIGILFTSLYNVGSGVLRAVGNSRYPLYYLVISSVLNIGLDILFVPVMGMGVEGVAIATIISQLVSALLVFSNMLRVHDVYRLDIKDLKIQFVYLKQIMQLGFPAAIQSCLLTISNLFIQGYINSFGSIAMAGIGAGKKIDKYIGVINISLGQASTNFISQNMGAKKPERAISGFRTCLLTAFIAMVVVGIPTYYFAGSLVRIFSADAGVQEYGIAMIHCLVPLYYLQSLSQVVSHSIRGFGKSGVVMVLALIGLVGVRQAFLAISMAVNPMIENIIWSYPVGWTAAAILEITYYLIFIKKKELTPMIRQLKSSGN